MKTCTLCGVSEPLVFFEPQRRQCKSCRAARKKVTRRHWYLKNAGKAIAYTREWRISNPDYRKAVEYVNRAETHKEKARLYRRHNPQKISALSRKYQCARISRTPKWLTDDDFWLMSEAYDLARLRTKSTGFVWEVDHIIPLRGAKVSGLHVPENLAVVPKIINAAKRNKFTV